MTNDGYVAMQVIQAVNGWLFGGPVLILLFGIHVYFTIYTGVVQRKLGTGIRLSLRGNGTEKKGMSSFGTLTTTLAATLGTGNIIGVSTAVSLGGPGAVFWCWLTGVLGMATTYAETTLCCTYRETQGREPVGGMMYVLKNALGKKKLASFYSFFICFSAYFAGCTTQSNAISETCRGIWELPKWLVGIIVALTVGLVILQGVKWIEKASMMIVPAMALLFVAGCLFYLVLHIGYFPAAIRQIVTSAFSPRCAAAGGAGIDFHDGDFLGHGRFVCGDRNCRCHLSGKTCHREKRDGERTFGKRSICRTSVRRHGDYRRGNRCFCGRYPDRVVSFWQSGGRISGRETADPHLSIHLRHHDLCRRGDAAWICVGNHGFCQFIFAGSLGVHIALLPENTPKEVEKGFLFVRNFPLVVSDNS